MLIAVLGLLVHLVPPLARLGMRFGPTTEIELLTPSNVTPQPPEVETQAEEGNIPPAKGPLHLKLD
jgi:hypothetical protein